MSLQRTTYNWFPIYYSTRKRPTQFACAIYCLRIYGSPYEYGSCIYCLAILYHSTVIGSSPPLSKTDTLHNYQWQIELASIYVMDQYGCFTKIILGKYGFNFFKEWRNVFFYLYNWANYCCNFKQAKWKKTEIKILINILSK